MTITLSAAMVMASILQITVHMSATIVVDVFNTPPPAAIHQGKQRMPS
ncbi:hypothetical protein J2849_000980 [Azospirillum melinis]|nr:hypothetical protein [Azospirillum melinis]